MKLINNDYNLFKLCIPKSIYANPNQFLNWYHCDSEENFKKDPHPKYIQDPFGYQFNNYGYRSDNFELDIDKEDQSCLRVVTIGCSISFGVGLPIEETYAHILCDKLSGHYKKKVLNYNLSANGIGADYIARMIYQTVSELKPNFIILLFPEFSRLEHYHESSMYESISATGLLQGFGESIKHIYENLITNKNHMFFNFVKNLNWIVSILDNEKIPYHWQCWGNDFLNGMLDDEYRNKIGSYIPTYTTMYDKEELKKFIFKIHTEPHHNKQLRARDWMHKGKVFHEYYATYLYDKIINENLIKDYNKI